MKKCEEVCAHAWGDLGFLYKEHTERENANRPDKTGFVNWFSKFSAKQPASR